MKDLMRMNPAVLLTAVVAGCGEAASPTVSDPDDLGREIVEALAKARGEEPTHHIAAGPRVPMDLSEIVIGTDTWNSIRDPDLAKAVGEYVKGEFPGGLLDCSMGPGGARCFPLSPDDLPPDGLLVFQPTPWDLPNTVTATHYDFVSAKGEPDGWHLERVLYSVDVERLGDRGWKVGKARDECCI